MPGKLLPRAPLRLCGSFHYAKEQETQGGKPDDADKGADKPNDDAPDDVLKLTKDELEQKIADALKADREKRKAKEKKQKEREADDDENGDDEEDAAEVISKAERRAAEAEQERDQAIKEALLAKVENKLRDYLTINFREFIGNAPDIMLHIEKALSPKSSEQEVARLIKSHAEAFVERTKAARRPASGAPAGGARGLSRPNVPGGSPAPAGEDREQRRAVVAKSEAGAAHKPFSTIHWNG